MNEQETQKQSKPNTFKRLSKRQRQFIPIWIQARSVAEACRKSGLNPVTFYEWRKTEAFRQALEAAQNESVAEAIAALKLMVSAAVAVMGKRLKSRGEGLQAARLIYDNCIKAIETIELERRISALETAQKQ